MAKSTTYSRPYADSFSRLVLVVFSRFTQAHIISRYFSRKSLSLPSFLFILLSPIPPIGFWGFRRPQDTTGYEILMGASYGLGALVCATRIPDRGMPGKFDIAGHSHQLFHLLVVAGAYAHYRAGLVYLKWRDVQGVDRAIVLNRLLQLLCAGLLIMSTDHLSSIS